MFTQLETVKRQSEGPARQTQVQGEFSSSGMSFLLSCLCHSRCSSNNFNIIIYLFLSDIGLVPKSEVQRETHEAAELSGRPETRVLPRPEEDEGAGRETGGRGAGTLLLLWR